MVKKEAYNGLNRLKINQHDEQHTPQDYHDNKLRQHVGACFSVRRLWWEGYNPCGRAQLVCGRQGANGSPSVKKRTGVFTFCLL